MYVSKVRDSAQEWLGRPSGVAAKEDVQTELAEVLGHANGGIGLTQHIIRPMSSHSAETPQCPHSDLADIHPCEVVQIQIEGGKCPFGEASILPRATIGN